MVLFFLHNWGILRKYIYVFAVGCFSLFEQLMNLKQEFDGYVIKCQQVKIHPLHTHAHARAHTTTTSNQTKNQFYSLRVPFIHFVHNILKEFPSEPRKFCFVCFCCLLFFAHLPFQQQNTCPGVSVSWEFKDMTKTVDKCWFYYSTSVFSTTPCSESTVSCADNILKVSKYINFRTIWKYVNYKADPLHYSKQL